MDNLTGVSAIFDDRDTKDSLGYSVVPGGIDAGRYATPAVAMQAYADEIHGLISDLSKDAMGVRLRTDFSDASFFQMEMEADYWASCVEREINGDLQAKEESAEAFNKYAPDAETAQRWMGDSGLFSI
jgi:hypothetical protein